MAEDLIALPLSERVKRYRVRAKLALVASQKMTDPTARAQFFQVAQGWNNLADILERTWELGEARALLSSASKLPFESDLTPTSS